jgi:RNA polymerase sigma factor (sigma-70 family)
VGEALAGGGVDEGEGRSDGELIEAVRRGDVTAYGVLYERHLGAARRAAGVLGVTAAEREDLVAEGFARVLRVLCSGQGPVEGFRPYLLTTMRNTVIDWRRRDRLLSLVADVPDTRPAAGSDEVVDARMQAELAADAFASLPERWRVVLWRTEIEDESPAKVAAALGMTANSVSALAYRAREGLRQAYLGQHMRPVACQGCDDIARDLAGWVRGRFSELKTRKIAAHLRGCADCRAVAADLRRLNDELPGISLLAVLCWSAPMGAGVAGVGLSLLAAGWVAGFGRRRFTRSRP